MEKLISISLKKKWHDSKLEIQSVYVDVVKSTDKQIKINESKLEFGCKTTINRSELEQIFFDNYERRNSNECHNIYLNVWTISKETEIENTIDKWIKLILKFAKQELNERMLKLTNLQHELENVKINKIESK